MKVALQLQGQKHRSETRLQLCLWSMQPQTLRGWFAHIGPLQQECSHWWFFRVWNPQVSSFVSFFPWLLFVLHSVLWLFEDFLFPFNCSWHSSINKSCCFKAVCHSLPVISTFLFSQPCGCSLARASGPFPLSERGGRTFSFLSFATTVSEQDQGPFRRGAAWTLLLSCLAYLVLGSFLSMMSDPCAPACHSTILCHLSVSPAQVPSSTSLYCCAQ